jgi:hypothetical protein
VTRHSGARALAREPGIHIHRWWLWIPGSAFGRPGMTGTHKKRARLTRVPQPAPGLGPARGVFRREMRAREGVRPRSAQEPSGARLRPVCTGFGLYTAKRTWD